MKNSNDETPERIAYSLAEVAAMVGKDRGWAYRMVKLGKLKVITGHGALMVPRSEVERLANGGEDSNPQD